MSLLIVIKDEELSIYLDVDGGRQLKSSKVSFWQLNWNIISELGNTVIWDVLWSFTANTVVLAFLNFSQQCLLLTEQFPLESWDISAIHVILESTFLVFGKGPHLEDIESFLLRTMFVLRSHFKVVDREIYECHATRCVQL